MSAVRIALANQLNNRAAPAKPALKARRARPPGIESHPLMEFADLYRQYFPKIFAYVYGRIQDRELTLDIVSDVFEKAFIHNRSLRSPDAFGSWLFTITRNEVSSHWRKEKPAARAMQQAAWEGELHHQPPSPEETLLHKEHLHSLTLLLRELSHREQEIISLKFDAELTNREIADVLKTSEVNVRVTVFRILRKLRERMQASGGLRR